MNTMSEKGIAHQTVIHAHFGVGHDGVPCTEVGRDVTARGAIQGKGGNVGA
jgi:hypothetical protein